MTSLLKDKTTTTTTKATTKTKPNRFRQQAELNSKYPDTCMDGRGNQTLHSKQLNHLFVLLDSCLALFLRHCICLIRSSVCLVLIHITCHLQIHLGIV